jgi:hypothetical protein
MEYRPPNWKNPHGVALQFDAFESGADTILRLLKEKGAWMTPEQMKLLAPDRKYPYGWIVFIPEDKENQASTTIITDAEIKTGGHGKILQVGKFIEHADGQWEIVGWGFDGNIPTEHADIEALKQDCMKRAKEAGTYVYMLNKTLTVLDKSG